MANSLAVMNDALHQFFDLNSLLMSLVATWIARWKPNEKKTFGYYRAGKKDFLTPSNLSFIAYKNAASSHVTQYSSRLRDRSYRLRDRTNGCR